MLQLDLKFKQLEEQYFIVDLLASEYGWTIDYIQTLTMLEIYGLVGQIFKRKGIDIKDVTKSDNRQVEMSKLLKLGRQLQLSPNQLRDIQAGKGARV